MQHLAIQEEKSVRDYLKNTLASINQQLDTLIIEKNVPYNNLFQAARYALLGEAKRIRPLLALATANMLGVPTENALIPACAIEMIHTYSLIHDDLPCMDNDDFRRGKPTVHKIYQEGHAVLTGDFLLTYAFEMLAEAPHLSDKQKVALISCLSKSAGSHGMIGGQVMDIAAEGKSLELDALRLLHRCKTGALISASIEFGIILANENGSIDTAHCATLRTFGENIGLAFQIVDDILDVTKSEMKHGKTIASDWINNKTTYVTLLGLEKAQQTAQELCQASRELLHSLPYPTDVLEVLVDSIQK